MADARRRGAQSIDRTTKNSGGSNDCNRASEPAANFLQEFQSSISKTSNIHYALGSNTLATLKCPSQSRRLVLLNSDLEDRKSTTGFVVLVYGCAVSWQSKKQATVASSTAEAEYMAVSEVLQEVKWIHQLMAELGLRRSKSISDDEAESESMSSSTVIFTDNRAAKSLCEAEGTQHSRTKHIDIRHHFIRDSIHRGEVRIEFTRWLIS
jgi:hypothetical protein